MNFFRLGLDPAGPYFSENDEEERISPNSAKFVDIIHTDGGSAGFYSRLGHVDFYPNGGTAIQPGCGWDILSMFPFCLSLDFLF